MRIRDARTRDLPAITEIYNDAVGHSTAIWNEQTVDVANRSAWWTQRSAAGYPVLVVETATPEGETAVAGYASFGDWRAFDGYRHTVEHSVYVHPGHRGRGVGELLMRELIARAAALGKHAMIAGIDAENTGSLRLHEKLGFERIGTFPEVGVKFGRWLDLTCMQLRIGEADAPPG